jgi:hypothetical protein
MDIDIPLLTLQPSQAQVLLTAFIQTLQIDPASLTHIPEPPVLSRKRKIEHEMMNMHINETKKQRSFKLPHNNKSRRKLNEPSLQPKTNLHKTMRSPILKNSNKALRKIEDSQTMITNQNNINVTAKEKFENIAQAIQPYLTSNVQIASELQAMTIKQATHTLAKELERLENICEHDFFKTRAIKLKMMGIVIPDVEVDNLYHVLLIYCQI